MTFDRGEHNYDLLDRSKDRYGGDNGPMIFFSD